MEHFVDSLQQLRGEFVWIDVFCVDQFAWTGQRDTQQVQIFVEKLTRGLEDQIRSIGRVALMLQACRDAMETLDQIWVLWEVFNTVQAGADLDILLSKEETDKLVKGMEHSSQEFMLTQSHLSRIDCGRARASIETDRNVILKQMQSKGLHEVDREVTKQIRAWLVSTGRKHLSSHPKIRHNFAILLMHQGLYPEAEQVCRQILPNPIPDLRNDGIEDDIVGAINNLAIILNEQGRHTEAEGMSTNALLAVEKRVGLYHPITLTYMSTLVQSLTLQGKTDSAEQLQRLIVRVGQKILQRHDADLVQYTHNLAVLLSEQGKFSEAENLHREAFRARSRTLNDEHPLTLQSLNGLANCLQELRKYSEAERYYRVALRSRRRVLGDKHSDTLRCMSNFAILLYRSGKLTEAEVLFRQSLLGQSEVLGCLHRATLTTKNNFAAFLWAQGEMEQAKEFFRECRDGYAKICGADHRYTLACQKSLDMLEKEEPAGEAKCKQQE